MPTVFFVFATLLLVSGFSTLFSAKSAVHEIEAFLMFLIATILIIGACVIDAIAKNTAAIRGEAVIEQQKENVIEHQEN